MTDQQKIKQLESENKELKDLLKEGKTVFTFLNDTLGIQKAAESNFFMAKIATIITKVQRNPDTIKNVTDYLKKVETYKFD